MKKGRNNKQRPPSRERYEKENPTVSGRMPKEKRDKFYANLAKSGRSVKKRQKRKRRSSQHCSTFSD